MYKKKQDIIAVVIGRKLFWQEDVFFICSVFLGNANKTHIQRLRKNIIYFVNYRYRIPISLTFRMIVDTKVVFYFPLGHAMMKILQKSIRYLKSETVAILVPGHLSFPLASQNCWGTTFPFFLLDVGCGRKERRVKCPKGFTLGLWLNLVN